MPSWRCTPRRARWKVHQILSLWKSEPRTRRGRGPRSRSSASRPGSWTTRKGRWHGISSSSHRGRSPSDRAPAAEALGGKNRGVSSAAAGGRSRGSRWTRWLVTRQWRRPHSSLGSREDGDGYTARVCAVWTPRRGPSPRSRSPERPPDSLQSAAAAGRVLPRRRGRARIDARVTPWRSSSTPRRHRIRQIGVRFACRFRRARRRRTSRGRRAIQTEPLWTPTLIPPVTR